jgi:hypothetical protein
VLAGRFSDALALYLQCYEDGASIPTFKGARNSGVLMQLAALGEKYPPAKAALLELREAARREALRDAGKASSVDDLAAINRVLHDDNSTIDLMDSLAADDARRRSLARGSFDELVRRGRYADALKGRDQFALMSMFDLTMSQATSAPPELQERVRAGAISNATRSIEALVGAGKLSAALDLARRVLAADGSSDTLQKLRAAALKAGNPGALDAILGK